MLWIDKRIGSGELAKYLAMLKVPVEVTDLAFGDFAFLGKGEEGVPVPVGIERKTLDDWVDSFYSGRFSGQLRGMLQCFQVIYVVIEGVWRINHDTGLIEVLGKKKKGQKKYEWVPFEVGNKQLLYKELEAMLITFENKGGCSFRFTSNKMGTGKFINTLYHWWNDKEWEEHRSHLRFRVMSADKAILIKPSLCREVAARLPGVGWVKSLEVALHFKSVRAMVQAPLVEWVTIPGIGKTMAERILAALKKGDPDG